MSDTYEELVEEVETLLTRNMDVVSPGLDLPVLADWVLVVATDDATNMNHGGYLKLHKPKQWRHRTFGLLLAAADDYRQIVKED